MKKKMISIICAAIMTLSLAACGNTSSGGSAAPADTGEEDASAAAETTEGAGGDTIRFAVAVPLTGDNAEQGM